MSILTRSYYIVRGLIGNVVLWFERRNPDALLENEKENLTEKKRRKELDKKQTKRQRK
jgi:hypothetical protein